MLNLLVEIHVLIRSYSHALFRLTRGRYDEFRRVDVKRDRWRSDRCEEEKGEVDDIKILGARP